MLVMAQGNGMPRLELIFLHSANAGGWFRWRNQDSIYLQYEQDALPYGSSQILKGLSWVDNKPAPLAPGAGYPQQI